MNCDPVAKQAVREVLATGSVAADDPGLTNAAKHAHASVLTVSISRTTDDVVAVICDDGSGDADPSLDSGLHGLADRVEALDGTLSIDSPSGRGTRVRATLPLRRGEQR